MLLSLFDLARGLVYGIPRDCALCGGLLDEPIHDTGVCKNCLSNFGAQMAWVCRVCGLPIAPPLCLCEICRTNRYHFDAQRSAGAYSGNLQQAVLRLKHGRERWLSRPLGRLLAIAAMPFAPFDFLIPIPLTPESAVRRGFNQALDLACEASTVLGVPVLDVLRRRERPEQQWQLSRNKRWENLKGSMFMKGPGVFDGGRVLLVDDVMTTGATLHEAARVLKGIGSVSVFGATAARTCQQ